MGVKMNKFSLEKMMNLSDENLVSLIRNSDDQAFGVLYERYLPKIRTMIYPFQGLGYDAEDLIQEATIGFYTAIQVFDASSASFATFCYTCMRRMLIALLRKSNRKKQVPTTSVIHTDESFFECVAPDNPEAEYIAKEDFFRLQARIMTELSQTERDVLYYYLSGEDYRKIGDRLGLSKKSVDNALQRIRRKLR